MARQTTGIDIGLSTNAFLRGVYKGNTFHVSAFALEKHGAGEVERGWESADPGFAPAAARIGLTGRDVNIRYTRVPRVPDWQLRKLMRFEVEEIGDQSGAEVSSDFNVLPALPEIEDEDVVLLGMARDRLLEQHLDGLAAIGGKLDAFSPNSLALYNAWLRYGVIEEDTVLLANIGHQNLDVILVRGPDLLFARNLTGGSKLFDDALADRFGVGARKAEEIKIRMATLEPGARYADANQEKASRAVLGAAGQLLSLLQSTVAFCKSQVKASALKVDRVLLCGGGARLAGLPAYLSQAMGVPVELFDPFRVVETGGLDPETADLLEAHRLESVVALGLATMASDPAAYSIEILPGRVRKQREFWGGTAWMIAAAILALAYVVYDGVQASRELSEAKARLVTANARFAKASKTHKRTEELLARNAELQDLSLQLRDAAGAGEQLARLLDVLQRRMPQSFWLNELGSSMGEDPNLRVVREAPRPILHLQGFAREGTEATAGLYTALVEGLREELPEAAIAPSLDPTGQSFTLDLTLYAPPPEEPEGEDAEGTEG